MIGMHTIEFCSGNLRSNRKVWKVLENYKDVELVDYGCLGYCGNCYGESFALVNGVLVSSTNAEELLKEIFSKLELEN